MKTVSRPSSESTGRTLVLDQSDGGIIYETQRIETAFLFKASTNPNAIAILGQGSKLSYGELEIKTRSFAESLRRSRPAGPVCIYAKRSVEMIISAIACSRAGYPFAILDAAYPAERIRAQAALLDPSAIIAAGVGQAELLSAFGSEFEDRFWVEANSKDGPNPLSNPTAPRSPHAYYLFTSGTTGKPKGILTGHLPLVHFVDFYIRRFKPGAGDRFSMLSGLGHDPILRDIFVPLSSGGTICIPDESILREPRNLFNWLRELRVTFIHTTPQMLKLIAAGAEKGNRLPDLKAVFSGGDILTTMHVMPLANISPGARFYNFYGASETPQAMAWHQVDLDAEDVRVPLGRGIDDVVLQVLDDDLSPLPPGVQGQIGILTSYLSDGYVGDVGATARQFLPRPTPEDPDARLYLTGDQGMVRDDGALVVTGRSDDQVKIRGYRVELSEVALAITKTGYAADVAVLAPANGTGERFLVAFVVRPPSIDESESLLAGRIRDCLAAMLPPAMVPAQYIWKECLPLTVNGKIDRKKLLDEWSEGGSDSVTELRDGDPQESLMRSWGRILATRVINQDDTFVGLGGDSLSFIQASYELQKLLGYVPTNWENQPLRELAASKPRKRGIFGRVDTSVVVRALSITTIVLGHFGVINAGDGFTTALFILSGLSFGKYQLKSIVQRGNAGPALITLLKFAVPTMLFALLFDLFFSRPHWQSILLVSNFVSPNFDVVGSFWFVQVLAQIYVVLIILFSIPGLRRMIGEKPWESSVAMTIASLAIALLSDYIWPTNELFHRVPQWYLWTAFLGMAIVLADSMARRLIVSGLLLLAAATGMVNLSPFLAIAAVVWIRNIPVLRCADTVVRYLAMSSLYIYLTHFQFLSIMRKVPVLGDWKLLNTAIALAGGVVIWAIADRSIDFVFSAIGKLAKTGKGEQVSSI